MLFFCFPCQNIFGQRDPTLPNLRILLCNEKKSCNFLLCIKVWTSIQREHMITGVGLNEDLIRYSATFSQIWNSLHTHENFPRCSVRKFFESWKPEWGREAHLIHRATILMRITKICVKILDMMNNRALMFLSDDESNITYQHHKKSLLLKWNHLLTLVNS